MNELPGFIKTVAGYRATLCQPKAWNDILRIIRNEENRNVLKAKKAQLEYENAVGELVASLRDKDFELLIDLVLSRTGWARLESRGGVIEGIDREVENVTSDEITF